MDDNGKPISSKVYKGQKPETPKNKTSPEKAPTSDILANYKDKKITWDEYKQKYHELLAVRKPLQNCDITKLDRICLLCTEKTANMCHRRLAAEYIAAHIPDTEIVHL